jgi:hypothetical protein
MATKDKEKSALQMMTAQGTIASTICVVNKAKIVL